MHTGPRVSSWGWVDMIEVCKKHPRNPEKWCQPGKEALPVVPQGLRNRTQSLFHGNPTALEFTSFSDMEPSEVFISSKMGFPDLVMEMRVWLERREVEVLCVRQPVCFLAPAPQSSKTGILYSQLQTGSWLCTENILIKGFCSQNRQQ